VEPPIEISNPRGGKRINMGNEPVWGENKKGDEVSGRAEVEKGRSSGQSRTGETG